MIGAGNRSFAGGRNWEESEYCVDAQSGLLTTYSPVPGLFVRYNYSSAIRFHDKSIPTGFIISEGGRTVAEARTISVTDPPAHTDAMFSPAGLKALGAGRAMNPGFNMPIVMPLPGRPFPDSNENAAMQVVTLHGNVSGEGRLSEVEILASSDASLNQAALENANTITQSRVHRQPGATAQSSEVILTFEFVFPGEDLSYREVIDQHQALILSHGIRIQQPAAIQAQPEASITIQDGRFHRPYPGGSAGLKTIKLRQFGCVWLLREIEVVNASGSHRPVPLRYRIQYLPFFASRYRCAPEAVRAVFAIVEQLSIGRLLRLKGAAPVTCTASPPADGIFQTSTARSCGPGIK